MDPERWRRIDALFHRALELAPTERAALFEAECRGDEGLRAEVERLVAADTGENDLVDRFEGGALRPPDDPLIGREIGRYRLTGRIAVGGMGVVYRAERTDGLFEHEVAIKLIRSEFASEGLIRRFEVERNTLASLHHPHIAQLHDGGTTSDGRPYLVMELVRGTPIDTFCDERSLSIESRLRVFVDVCRTVHFAHQNLVVHRDLKPANILIDETGAPKLLDFGIARLLDEENSAPGLGLTQTGAHILTPEYASPEQLTRGAVTTAMDVYSLGIVLYELMTGRLPFPSADGHPIEWLRAVCEHSPMRPSLAASLPTTPAARAPGAPTAPDVLATRRGSTQRSLKRRLAGDIDRIVLMALRKEPERRYASAKDMADDVERHLSGHPLLARGDSVTYSTMTFVRRNRLVVGSAAVVLVALVFGIVAARRGEKRARAEAEHARVEADSFQGVAEFLLDTFLTSTAVIDTEQVARQHQRIRVHAARLRQEYAGHDHLRANLLDSLGHVAQRLGLFDDAEELLQEALSIRAKAFGQNCLEYALSLRSLGQLRLARGDLTSAAALLSEALELHRTHEHETHTDVAAVANDLGACLRELGRLDEAERLHREALGLRRANDDGSLAVAESLNNLAGVHLDRNDRQGAVRLLEEALAIRGRILGSQQALTLQSMSDLATACRRTEQHERALRLLDEVEAGCRALRTDGEELLANVLSNRAAMLIEDGEYQAAEPLLSEALQLQTRRLGPLHPALANTLAVEACLQEAQGRPVEARASLERVLAMRRQPGASPSRLAQALCDYGVFLATVPARDDARAALSEAIDVLRAQGSHETPLRARAELRYGEVLLSSGDVAGARVHLDKAVSIFAGTSSADAPGLAEAQAALKRCDALIAR